MNPPTENTPPCLALRPVAPPDESFLLRLYATTRAAELERTGWDAVQRDAFVRSQYQARRADYVANYPDAEHAVITADGKDAGTWIVRHTPGDILLVNIELLPEYQGKGIGSTFLRTLITQAKDTRRTLRLSVHRHNQRANRLYKKFGFLIHGRSDEYLLLKFDT